MRKVSGILVAALVAAVPLFGQWTHESRISETSGDSYTASSGGLCVASDGELVHIVWEDQTFSESIRYVWFEIWDPPLPGVGQAISTSEGYQPVLAVKDFGVVHMDWCDPDNANTLLFCEVGQSPGALIEHGGSAACNPAITYSESGTYCAYSRRNDIYFQRYNADSAGFSLPVVVYAPGLNNYPSICKDTDTVHIIFGSSNGNRIIHAYSADSGATWSAESVTAPNTTWHDYSCSVWPSGNNLYVAYVSYGFPHRIYVTDNSSGAWSTPVNVSDGTSECFHPSICRDALNNIWVVWQQAVSGVSEIYYNRYDSHSGTWDGPQPLTSPDGYHSCTPHIIAGWYETLHLCWYDYRHGNAEIYHNWHTTDSPYDFDLEMVQIIRPESVETPGEGFLPQCMVFNNQVEVVEAEMRCRIRTLPSQETVYEDVILYPIDPGYTVVEAFKEFIPEAGKEYEALFVVEHPDDINAGNNKLSKTFNTFPGVTEDPPADLSLDVTARIPALKAPIINFSLAEACAVDLRVYDVSGKLVITLAEGSYSAGHHTVNWNAADVTPGVYFVRLSTAGMVTAEFSKTTKVVMAR